MNEQDAKIKYADIIRLPHHQSTTRAHMSLYDRAAQFAPFAALSGYDDLVVEEARLTDHEKPLSEEEEEELNRVIALSEAALSAGAHPQITVTYFKPDELKSGGCYITVTGLLKRIDRINQVIVLYGGERPGDRRSPDQELDVKAIHAIEYTPKSDIEEVPHA